jgi:putative hydrolase of the HAD superfamily
VERPAGARGGRLVRFRAVFFDAGETLVHPVPSFHELFATIVTREGHPRDPDDVVAASSVVVQRFSDAARDNTLWTTSPERSHAFWLDVYERMLKALDLPNGNGLRDTLYDAFTDHANYGLFDDVRPTLHAVSASGATLGIVSNFEAWLEDLLVALDVREAFEVSVISGCEGVEKPDPAIYRLALDRAGVAPQDAAFVGDNPEFDIDPPASLGMFPVLIDRRGRHTDYEGPGVRITDLADLMSVLEA